MSRKFKTLVFLFPICLIGCNDLLCGEGSSYEIFHIDHFSARIDLAQPVTVNAKYSKSCAGENSTAESLDATFSFTNSDPIKLDLTDEHRLDGNLFAKLSSGYDAAKTYYAFVDCAVDDIEPSTKRIDCLLQVTDQPDPFVPLEGAGLINMPFTLFRF